MGISRIIVLWAFKNVPIKIVQSNWEDPLFAECKKFTCYAGIDKLFKKFWFSSTDSETTQYSRETFIHVKMSNEYYFDHYKLLDESDVDKTYKTKFPDHSPMSECELIIPMKYLYSVYYDRDNIHSLISHKDKLEFMNEISKAQKISCSITEFDDRNTYVLTWKRRLKNVNPGVGSIPLKSIVIFKHLKWPLNC